MERNKGKEELFEEKVRIRMKEIGEEGRRKGIKGRK